MKTWEDYKNYVKTISEKDKHIMKEIEKAAKSASQEEIIKKFKLLKNS
jgi:hypothetical protein